MSTPIDSIDRQYVGRRTLHSGLPSSRCRRTAAITRRDLPRSEDRRSDPFRSALGHFSLKVVAQVAVRHSLRQRGSPPHSACWRELPADGC
jgi:hypothetical protein